MFAKMHVSRVIGSVAAMALVAGCATTPKVDEKALAAAAAKPPAELTVEERVAKAQLAVDQGDCTAARSDLDKALEKQPDNVDANYLMARCLDMAGEFSEAGEAYRKVLAAEPTHENALLGIGLVYKRNAQYDDAIALYTAALEADPENVKVRNNLGVIYRLAGQYDLAEAAFRRVLARKQGDVDAYKNLVVLYMEQDKLVLAEQFSLEARKINDKDAGIWTNLGLIWFKRAPNKPTRALDAFFKAVELDETNVAAHENIAAIALRYRDYATAAQHAQKAVELEPNSWQAQLALAYSQDGQKLVDEAVASYDKVLALRPVTDELTADIIWSKGMLFKSAQDWENAQTMLQQYKSMDGLNNKRIDRVEGELQGVDYMLSLQQKQEPAPAIGDPTPESIEPEEVAQESAQPEPDSEEDTLELETPDEAATEEATADAGEEPAEEGSSVVTASAPASEEASEAGGSESESAAEEPEKAEESSDEDAL